MVGVYPCILQTPQLTHSHPRAAHADRYSGQVPERDEAFAACALLLGCIVTARALSMLDSHVEEDFDGVGGGGSGGGGSGSSDGRLPKGAESAGAAHIEGGTYWDNIVIVEVFWCIVRARSPLSLVLVHCESSFPSFPCSGAL